MRYQSKNMSYIFNYEYFDELDLMGSSSKLIEDKNSEILRFKFMEKTPVTEWRQLEGFEIIELFTLYPGMLMGLGNIHEIKMEGAIKCGFNFDYTTGTPFIPGSSLKGMLRSYFPKTNSDEELIEYIKSLLPEKEKSEENELDVIDFRDKLFVGDTIYLGAYPAIDKPMSLISMEYITKHNGFKNPNPVSLIKVKPGVKFEFCFALSDILLENGQIVKKDAILQVFKGILIDMGAGAKTNTGFGNLSEKEPKEPKKNIKLPDVANTTKVNNAAPLCRICHKNRCDFNTKYNNYFHICQECNKKKRSRF